MKKILLTSFVALCLLATSTSFAQIQEGAAKKEAKADKKDRKMLKKEDRHHMGKAEKKEEKMDKKAEKGMK